MNDDMHFGLLIKILRNKIEQSFNNNIQDMNITRSQLDILLFLNENKEIEIQEFFIICYFIFSYYKISK